MARRRKARKKSPNQVAYQNQIKRIKRAFSTLEKSGYRFSEDLEDIISEIKEVPKRITKQEIQKLKRITPAVLRKHATALSETGKIVSGTERFRELRRESARRAAQTRKRKQAIAALPNIVDIVLENVEDLIRMNPSNKGAEYLQNLLDSEIKKYGRKKVAQAMMKYPTWFIEQAQNIIYYPDRGGSGYANRALIAFSQMIRDNLPDDSESRELGDVLDEMEEEDELY